MKKVAVMCRVSSDDQAKGYSLDDQEERIRKYCALNDYEIVYFFKEDHSAKSFDRPEWAKWMKWLKYNHKQVDMLMVTSWDRFARDITGAYAVIKKLRHTYTVEPQAIEQPIDYRVPEHKAILAMYLTIPEIDNDRRSIKIRGGIRQALKQGRWVRAAVFGYKNERDDNNKPVLVPDPEKAWAIQYIFESFAKGTSQAAIRAHLKMKGVKVSRNNLSQILRRVIYTGKILVPAEEDEPSQIVNGIHEPLIPESLFYKAQILLDEGNKSKNKAAKYKARHEELPLRGHLNCTKCGSKLTGSGSRGKLGKRYFYYHCNSCKDERYRAHAIHEKFELMLEEFKVSSEAEIIYNEIVEKLLSGSGDDRKKRSKQLLDQIDQQDKRLKNLQDLLADGNLSAEDYQSMRSRYEAIKVEMKEELSKIKAVKDDFERYIESGIRVVKNLRKVYYKAGLELKQKIVGSIFIQNLSFDGKNCRTRNVNRAVRLICQIDNELRGNKKGQLPSFLKLSLPVETKGVEPSTS